MKILFLCNKSPWPPKEGGPMAMNMLIEGLCLAGHQVKVLALNSFKYYVSPADIPGAYLEKTGIELIDVDLHIKPLHAFLNLFSSESYHVKRFISGKFRERLAGVLKAGEFDVVQIETLYMCPYVETIRRHSRARIVLRAHNIEHLIWQRIADTTSNPVKKRYVGHLARTLKIFEENAIGTCDGIMAITPTDADYFRRYVPSSIPVIDLPFGVDPEKYKPDNREVEFPSLFSLGSMNWMPNEEGIRWFLLNVWLDVHKQFPDLKYYIAGRGMPKWMLNLDLPNVVVLGEVPDAPAFLASKAIMVVPLFSGSGIRIKIIEGMAAGKTIVSTSLGAEGIRCTNHENILIANAPCEFFEMISLCAADRELSEKIGKQAQTLIETDYLPHNIIQSMLAFYKQLIC